MPQDLAGMLGWDIQGGSPFRKLLAHPKLLPYYEELCGKGYRCTTATLAPKPRAPPVAQQRAPALS